MLTEGRPSPPLPSPPVSAKRLVRERRAGPGSRTPQLPRKQKQAEAPGRQVGALPLHGFLVWLPVRALLVHGGHSRHCLKGDKITGCAWPTASPTVPLRGGQGRTSGPSHKGASPPRAQETGRQNQGPPGPRLDEQGESQFRGLLHPWPGGLCHLTQASTVKESLLGSHLWRGVPKEVGAYGCHGY